MGEQIAAVDCEVLMTLRPFVYGTLSRAFTSELDERFYNLLVSEAMEAVLGVYAEECGFASTTSAFISDFRDKGFEETQTRLKSEFARFFLGPGRLPAPVCETFYRTGIDEAYSHVSLAVRSLYRENSFSTESFPFMPDDHIAIEFAFCASLAQNQREAIEMGDNASLSAALKVHRRFLREHVNQWLKDCGEGMLNAERDDSFYPSLVAFATQFCHEDEKFLASFAG